MYYFVRASSPNERGIVGRMLAAFVTQLHAAIGARLASFVVNSVPPFLCTIWF
jgi:hypothetical protein